jgi:superfamily II DNA/RNA helicase
MDDANFTFTGLGLVDELVKKLNDDGKFTPTAVQIQAMPLILSGAHVFFQSETGTGKTIAYLLPLIQALVPGDLRVQVVIAAPTHELASQIKQETQKFCERGAALCIGSAPLSRQIELLKAKPAFVIGNQTRITELINLRKLKPEGIQTRVLDEADRLFSREQINDTSALLSQMPDNVRVIACSATIRPKIVRDLTQLVNTNEHKIQTLFLPPEDVLKRRIEHQALYCEGREKFDTLRKYLVAVQPKKALVFTARTGQTEFVVRYLRDKQVDCAGIHAKLGKMERKQAIDRFRSGKSKLLVTSDLSARGLDIQGITHIIQLDLPDDDDFFIHRAGRTARAGNSGVNIVIGDEREMERYAALEKRLELVVYPKELYGGKLQTCEG